MVKERDYTKDYKNVAKYIKEKINPEIDVDALFSSRLSRHVGSMSLHFRQQILSLQVQLVLERWRVKVCIDDSIIYRKHERCFHKNLNAN